MIDLNLFRALEASRRIVAEELEPAKAPRPMTSETTPKHVSATSTANARIKTQSMPRVRTQP
jgi:hypothetical protein